VREAFLRDGLAGPIPLLDAAECSRIASYLGRREFDLPVEDRQSCLSPDGQAGLPVLHFQSFIAAERVAPGSFACYPSGQYHIIRNPGTEEARYLVFEFHSPGAAVVPRRRPLYRRAIRFMRRALRF
jgi:hypothetical protein